MIKTKRGDIIQQRKDIPKGKSLMHGYESLERAMTARNNINQYYNLPVGVSIKCDYDDLNPRKYAVVADEDTYTIVEAKVNWVVEQEAGITYLNNGSSAVIDLLKDTGWVVIKSAPPAYQSDVEHMSDEELRASIEALRSNKIMKPVAARKKTTPKEPAMSAQDKALMKVLSGMSPEQQAALKAKLGLV